MLFVCCLAVADLMYLVQACRSQPDMEQQLRETLNMARDVDKWRNLTKMLSKKVPKMLIGCTFAEMNG